MARDLLLVSVLMPAYNCGNFVVEAIQAILNQSFTDFEFIIINDGSTDDTKANIITFQDSRIKYFENTINSGIVVTLNKGFEIAKGKYIVRTDADDIALADMLENLVYYMEQHDDCVACGANMKLINGEKLFTYPSEDAELKIHTLNACPFSHSTVIFRRALMLKNKLFYDSSMKDAEDYALWSALLPYGKFHNLEKVTLLYRESTTQVTAQKTYSDNRLKALVAIYKFHANNYFQLYGEDAKLYTLMVQSKVPANFEEMKRIGALQVAILKTNKANNYFEQKRLKNFLFIKWYWLCSKYTPTNYKIFFLYCNNLLKTGNFFKLLHVINLAIKS